MKSAIHSKAYWAILAAIFAACQGDSIFAWDDAIAPPLRKLRVAYFIPSDRKPEPDYVARLDRVLSEVQQFFHQGMRQNGHGERTFELDRDAAGRLRVFTVQGKHPMRTYGRNAASKVREEVKDALAKQQVDIDRETTIIFQLLLEWKDNQAIEIGPYVGGGNAQNGTAWVYDDARLDPLLLPSKESGGYYHRPCSLGEFNTHYIGGVAHELGHAFGLPHERERTGQTATHGKSLMGSGNHTYGQELRGEGRGAFLTAAAALPLSVHPLFRPGLAQAELTCQLDDLQASARPNQIALEGKFSGGPRLAGVVAYNDPQSVAGDYDSVGWASAVDSEGRFQLTIEDLEPGSHELRLRAVGETGSTKSFSFSYEVNAQRLPQIESLLEAPWLLRAFDAYRNGDQQRLAALVDDTKRTLPKHELLHRKIAHYRRLSSAKPLMELASLSATVKTAPLSQLAWDSGSSGWGKPLRNQVPANGDTTGLLEVGGRFFEAGLFAHAPARHEFRLNNGWTTFSTKFGLQDRHRGSVVFVVKGDGKELFRSPRIADHQVREQTIVVTDVSLLELIVEDAGDGGNSDWGVWLEPTLQR